MTRRIELPPAFEEIAAAQAQKNGQSLEEYLPELITEALAQKSRPANQSDQERTARIRRFRQWAEDNAPDTPYLADTDISREAIYGKF